jgi:coniferyl-aldehyde dehydrogenase
MLERTQKSESYFETFSKLRPVFYQARFSTMKFMMPPYGKLADRLLAFLAR